MIFSSAIFVFGFIPVLLLIYFICPKKLRNYVLLVFSLVFYGWDKPFYLVMLVTTVLINYLAALLIDKYRYKSLVIGTIVINVAILIYFKYYNFFITIINDVIKSEFSLINVILPIGISFYTFQTISYIIDVYKQDITVQKNPSLIPILKNFCIPRSQLRGWPTCRYFEPEKNTGRRGIRNFYASYG